MGEVLGEVKNFYRGLIFIFRIYKYLIIWEFFLVFVGKGFYLMYIRR